MPALRFANDGGPLIACDARLADQWHGNRSDDHVKVDPVAEYACIEDAVSGSVIRGICAVSCRVLSCGGGLYNLVQWQPSARTA